MREDRIMATQRSQTNPFDVRKMMNELYGDTFLRFMDLLDRRDFYGVSGPKTLTSVEDKLGLTEQSHMLDLCCGIGGPARFLASKHGCRVTGVDLSEFNHRIAKERTKAAGLDDRVRFIHGNILEHSFPENSFSHVFGCDAWFYFKDKSHVYSAAHRALTDGGRVCTIEAAHESPRKYNFEKVMGKCHYESMPNYIALLQANGFTSVTSHDVTQTTLEDVMDALHGLIVRRQEAIDRFGSDMYYLSVELWAEFLTFYTRQNGTHVCIVGTKN
jgi:ubiquinone/menaquinone biosynthesis C-methylase UbiE